MIDEKKLASAAMSEEELDNVAGGNCFEMSNDSRFLNSLNGSTNRYRDIQIVSQGHHQEIKKGWATVGIDCYLHPGIYGDNRYYLDGKQITQEQARQHAMNVVGKQMTESDWKY